MVNIAVMGYGTVGSGVVEVIDTNGKRINQRIGEELNIKYVLDLKDFPGNPVQEKIIHDLRPSSTMRTSRSLWRSWEGSSLPIPL